jgi:hypothetical protein
MSDCSQAVTHIRCIAGWVTRSPARIVAPERAARWSAIEEPHPGRLGSERDPNDGPGQAPASAVVTAAGMPGWQITLIAVGAAVVAAVVALLLDRARGDGSSLHRALVPLIPERPADRPRRLVVPYLSPRSCVPGSLPAAGRWVSSGVGARVALRTADRPPAAACSATRNV